MSIRSGAAIKLGLGVLGAVVVGAALHYVRTLGYAPTSLAMIPLAIPGAFALIGLLELVTGVPFQHTAQKWDELAGWQRGILGLVVVVIAFIVMGGVMILVGS